MFPSVAAYASASHSATHTPVDVTGIEPAKASLQNLGLPNLLSTHPTILFWLGNRRPSGGRTDALCWPGASGSRGARPEPLKQEKGLLLPLPFTLLQRRTRVAEETRARL